MEPPVTLEEKVRSLPMTPGVYLMKDARGQIIYVGKSKQLRSRVSSYFHSSKSHTPKTKRLVGHIRDLDWILTDTEFEAFMLECRLIKEYKPMYNRKMKTPQSYTYIAVSEMSESLRSLAVAGSPEEPDKFRYFGPYPSRSTVERAVLSLQEYHRILCSHPASARSSTACLNHSIGLCRGMCAGGAALEEYRSIMEQIVAFLEGTDTEMLEGMKRGMEEAAASMEFEKAAKLRDAIGAAGFLQQREQVNQFTGENRRIAVIEALDGGSVKLFLLQRNRILHRAKYEAGLLTDSRLHSAVKAALIETFGELTAPAAPSPISRDEIDEAQIIYSYITGGSCRHLFIQDSWLAGDNETLFDQALEAFLNFVPDSGSEPL